MRWWQHQVCIKTLRGLTSKRMQESWSWPFMSAVDISAFPDYPTIVAQPMDLGLVKAKLGFNHVKCQYQRLREYERDVQLVFENALLYNAVDKGQKGTVYEAARHLLEQFKSSFEHAKTEAMENMKRLKSGGIGPGCRISFKSDTGGQPRH